MPPARAETGTTLICQIVVEAGSGRVLMEEGTCDRRVTPASTFKIPLAVMAFDAAILSSAEAPVLHWRTGEPDWGGAAWRGAVSPASWMRDSVVWYSQRLTRQLGAARFAHYASAFGHGNADVSGDAGLGNGLERAWLSSSLEISPREQVAFLSRLLARDLPVARTAMDDALALVESRMAEGWQISGKTGGAYPRRADRSFDYARGYGWFVGWAERGGRKVVFARLAQDTRRLRGSPGLRARDALLRDWPRIALAIGG